MAVRTSCPSCGKPFSAPEDYLGRKIECPKCGHRSVLRHPDEIEEERRRKEQERLRTEENLRRLALIEREEERRRRREAERFADGFTVTPGRVRHYEPGAPTRYQRLRALSDLMLLGAYVVLVVGVLGAGATVSLWVGGALSAASALALLGAWVGGGTALYLLLKWIAELSFVVADLGDGLEDGIRLLLDLRESVERVGGRRERDRGPKT